MEILEASSLKREIEFRRVQNFYVSIFKEGIQTCHHEELTDMVDEWGEKYFKATSKVALRDLLEQHLVSSSEITRLAMDFQEVPYD